MVRALVAAGIGIALVIAGEQITRHISRKKLRMLLEKMEVEDE